jgi:hypothetical protein
VNAAVGDWNTRPTTVRMQFMGDQNWAYDLNIIIDNIIFGDPGILGIALPYDENVEFCFENCTIWYGDVVMADIPHFGPYGTTESRRATTAHEIGHQFALAHESVDEEGYSTYLCGQDYLGAIPLSIMSYNCGDPVEYGGQGMFIVQPWDVCGVNHAYFDPTIGYAGCEGYEAPTETPTATATPEPTPTQGPTATTGPTPTATPAGPTPEPSATNDPPQGPTATPQNTPPLQMTAWGNVDCDENLSSRDSQSILRVVLSQPTLSQTQPCKPIGDETPVDGFGVVVWGDADCDGELTTRDNQAVMRKVLSQAALSQTAPCPAVGTDVAVNSE